MVSALNLIFIHFVCIKTISGMKMNKNEYKLIKITKKWKKKNKNK